LDFKEYKVVNSILFFNIQLNLCLGEFFFAQVIFPVVFLLSERCKLAESDER